MKVRNNMTARYALRGNSRSSQAMDKNLEKLASGLRINRAGDDAAGLSISEKLRANITEASRCQKNVMEGLDLTRTADGALAEINDMLRRAKALCLEAENGTYSEQERASISEELTALFDEIDRISEGSYHNTIQLFRGGKNEQTVLELPGNSVMRTSVLDEQSVGAASALFQSSRAARAESADDGTLGKIDFIQDGPFDPATPPAVAATATFTLVDEIDVDNADTMAGRSIRISEKVFYFTKDSNSTYTPYVNIEGYDITVISLENCTGFDEAMDRLVNSCDTLSGWSKVYDNKKQVWSITLTASIDDLVDTVKADGQDNDYFIKSGDGSKKNGVSVSNPYYYIGKTLGQVDSVGADNNTPKSATKANMSFDLGNINGSLSANDIANLNRNSIYMYFNGSGIRLDLSYLNFREGMSKKKLGKSWRKRLSMQSKTTSIRKMTIPVKRNIILLPARWISALNLLPESQFRHLCLNTLRQGKM